MKENWFSTLGERFNSTLFIAFLFYITICNWQISMYFINTDLITDEMLFIEPDKQLTKIDFITNYINKHGQIWLPALYAALSVIIFPIINGGVSFYNKFIRSHRDNINKEIERKYYRFSEDAFIRLEKENKTFTEHLKVLEQNNAQLLSSNKDLLASKKQIEEEFNLLEGKNKEMAEELKDYHTDSLASERRASDEYLWDEEYNEFISNSPLYEHFEPIGKDVAANLNLTTDQIIIEKYKRLGLIQKSSDEKGRIYQFTPKGQHFWWKYIDEYPLVESDNLSFEGELRLGVNISTNDRQKFLNLFKNNEKFNSLTTSFHENVRKKDYFTFVIENANDQLYNYFQKFLKENNIEFIDYQFMNN